ncbi:hypothetical protein EKM05_12165 [Flavobacterium sp. GSP27]|uniref:hypothetical protein n=1 Tax=Flavobacterium sp. GSP27 TaxID=2497489 RepID=UPI000F82F32E|nr:hypothetical protein [Flavobacterium sp. GSP27]RTY94288.1 hypothetical protein EKL32_12630 [Flavobacterium sp. GSN2]RTZ06675.1 hypothetical protein EKM05_12165 [Flavobacterium sp. GSP27]
MNKITFEEYKRAIKVEYQVSKMDEVSGILLNPTPAQLRNLCLMKLGNGLSNADENVFKMFFDAKAEDTLRRVIENFDLGKFKPIISFLKGQKDSDTAARIELAAILVDFIPRPYNTYLLHGKSSERDAQESVKAFQKKRMTDVGIQLVDPTNNVLAGISQYAHWRKSGIILAILMVLFFMGYTVKGVFFAKKDCMKWEGNYYVAVDCLNDYGQFGISSSIDEEVMKLKKVDCSSTLQFFNKETPIVWYCKRDGVIELFNMSGFHPVTGKPLKPITKYIIKKYNLMQ